MPRAKYKKRADGRYLVQIFIGYNADGKKKYKNLYGKTTAELDDKVAEYKRQMNNGIVIDDKNITAGKWAEIWLNTYKANVGLNTKKMYENCINNHILGSDIASIPLSKIKKQHIQKLINEKVEIGLTRTVEILRIVLKDMFDQAVENDLIIKSPAARIPIPKFKSAEKRAITEIEHIAIRQADLTDKERLFIYLGLYAGLRRGESLALTKQDIDLTTPSISINKTVIFDDNKGIIKDVPKTEAGTRNIPIIEPLFSHIKKYMSEIDTDLLFTTKTGDTFSRSAYRKMWDSILKKLNQSAGCEQNPKPISDLTSHILRHTFSTNLYYAGIDIKTAQSWLGHKDIKTTLEIYTHLNTNFEESKNKLSSYILSHDF